MVEKLGYKPQMWYNRSRSKRGEGMGKITPKLLDGVKKDLELLNKLSRQFFCRQAIIYFAKRKARKNRR